MSNLQSSLRFSRPPIAILGVPLENVTTSETVSVIEEMIASRRSHYIVTANVDFLTQATGDVELRRILFDSDLALCDGTPVLWASRFLGNPLPERVAGSDLVPLLIEIAAQKGYRLFFLGSTPETGQAAMARLRERFPGLQAIHYSPPFSHLLEMDHEEITRRIREANPDVLFVCFGCPKQEKWMAMHHRALGVPVSMGVGGTLDFLAGHLKRAPRWMQSTGTEWVFRLLQEPKRLFRRYVRDFRVFGMGIAAQWWRLRTRRRRGRASGTPVRSTEGNGADDGMVPISLNRKQGEGDPRPSPPLQKRDQGRGGVLPELTANVGGEGAETGPRPPSDVGDESVQKAALPVRFDCAATRADPRWVDRILADGRHCLVDMSGVQFLDSTGIGVLIRLRKSLRAARRELVLVAPSKRVSRALSMMRLESFFDFAPDEASATRLVAERVSELLSAVDGQNRATVAWRGEVTAGNAAEVWEQTKRALGCARPAELLIDLSRVRFIDSTGLGLMVRARKLAEQQGNSVTFLNPGPSVKNVVRVAGLEGLLFSKAARTTTRSSQTKVATACAT